MICEILDLVDVFYSSFATPLTEIAPKEIDQIKREPYILMVQLWSF